MAKITARLPRKAHADVASETVHPANGGHGRSSLTHEYKSWRRSASRHAAALIKDIQEAASLCSGRWNSRRVKQAVHRYLLSRDAQLLALRRARSRGASGSSPTWEHEFAAEWTELHGKDRLDELNPTCVSTERFRFHLQPKRSGGHRRIWQFGPYMTARQLLVTEALKPLAEWRLWMQLLYSLGRVRGLESIEKALEDPSITHFAIVDIAGFFDNVDLRGATQLPIELSVLENTLCVTPFERDRSDQDLFPNECVRAAVVGPLALPQGAASSPLLAYWLLEEAFAIQDYEFLFPFADDLLILGSSEEEVAARVSRYQENLIRHPVGPLRLGSIERGQIDVQGIPEFLGVEFDVRHPNQLFREVRAKVSEDGRNRFRDRVRSKINQDLGDNHEAFDQTRVYVTRFLEAMPTSDHAELRSMAERLINAARGRRQSVAQLPSVVSRA